MGQRDIHRQRVRPYEKDITEEGLDYHQWANQQTVKWDYDSHGTECGHLIEIWLVGTWTCSAICHSHTNTHTHPVDQLVLSHTLISLHKSLRLSSQQFSHQKDKLIMIIRISYCCFFIFCCCCSKFWDQKPKWTRRANDRTEAAEQYWQMTREDMIRIHANTTNERYWVQCVTWHTQVTTWGETVLGRIMGEDTDGELGTKGTSTDTDYTQRQLSSHKVNH